MNRVVLIVLVMCWSVNAAAQGVDPALMRAVVDSEKARRAGDANVYADYLTEDAIFTGANGETETKAQRVAKVRPLEQTTDRTSDEKYRVYGDTVIRTWRVDGARADRRIQVWVKQGGKWRIASLQITEVK